MQRELGQFGGVRGGSPAGKTEFMGSPGPFHAHPEVPIKIEAQQELSEGDIQEMHTLEDVKRVLSSRSGVRGSNEALRGKGELLTFLEGMKIGIDNIHAPSSGIEVLASHLPRTYGFRDRVKGLALQEWAMKRLSVAETLAQIQEAIAPIQKFPGSSHVYSKEEIMQVLKPIEMFITSGRLGYAREMTQAHLTNAYGLREAVIRTIDRAAVYQAVSKESSVVQAAIPTTRETPVVNIQEVLGRTDVPVETRLQYASTLEDIERVINNCKGISGSQYYNPFDLLHMIRMVRDAARMGGNAAGRAVLGRVTSGQGLRQAIERVLSLNEGKS